MKIVLEHISKRYPNRDKKVGGVFTAVDDFDLTIPDGTLIGLLGPSGCGKSTTLNMICGLETPTEGKIWFGDTDVTKLTPELRGVGMVFQSYALYPHLTVRQNIMFPLENLKGADKLSKDEMLRRVENAAGLVQISELLDRKPNEMSGGQQQRVAIARALVKTPKVLLLDEPLSNLDARLRLTTREEIRRIQRETGITTIFVTHDQEEAMSICDEIVVMERGIIRQVGKPQHVYDEPENLFVSKFLGTPPINVFEGRVENERLFIGTQEVLDVYGAPDGAVSVGIRPEGFVPEEDGPLTCGLIAVERMGRDTSVVAKHDAHDGVQMRAIVSSDARIDTASDTVRFRIRPEKCRLFDAETGQRVHFFGETMEEPAEVMAREARAAGKAPAKDDEAEEAPEAPAGNEAAEEAPAVVEEVATEAVAESAATVVETLEEPTDEEDAESAADEETAAEDATPAEEAPEAPAGNEAAEETPAGVEEVATEAVAEDAAAVVETLEEPADEEDAEPAAAEPEPAAAEEAVEPPAQEETGDDE